MAGGPGRNGALGRHLRHRIGGGAPRARRDGGRHVTRLTSPAPNERAEAARSRPPARGSLAPHGRRSRGWGPLGSGRFRLASAVPVPAFGGAETTVIAAYGSPQLLERLPRAEAGVTSKASDKLTRKGFRNVEGCFLNSFC